MAPMCHRDGRPAAPRKWKDGWNTRFSCPALMPISLAPRAGRPECSEADRSNRVLKMGGEKPISSEKGRLEIDPPFLDELAFTCQAIPMDCNGESRLLVRRGGRLRAHDRAPTYDIGRNSPENLRRKQDAHLEDGLGFNALLSAEKNAGPADVYGGSFVPESLPALTITQGCPNGETLGTRPVLASLLTRIARQFNTLVRMIEHGHLSSNCYGYSHIRCDRNIRRRDKQWHASGVGEWHTGDELQR